MDEKQKLIKQTKVITILGAIAIFFIMTVFTFCVKAEPIIYKTIAYESSGEPLAAQAMVAKVIRVRAKERNQSYKEIVLAPYQFSCWNEGADLKDRTQKELETAKTAWELSKEIEEEPNLYHDISIVAPYWANSPKVEYLFQLGNIKFYREKQ